MGTDDDAFISSQIINAQSDLDAQIGFSFQQDGTAMSPASRIYDGTGAPFLMIDNLVSLSSVVEVIRFSYQGINGVWLSGVSTTNTITADVVCKPNNFASKGLPAYKLVRTSGNTFAAGTLNYTVSGVFGMPIVANQVTPGVPNDISRACLRLAIHYFKMRDTAYADMVQAQGGIREKYMKGWPEDVKDTVRNHQRTRFFNHIDE